MEISSKKRPDEKPKIEEKDKLIIKELIKRPRISDSAISKNTGIPVKTVNRRRKYLEKSNTLNYMTFVNNFPGGTARFNSMALYTILFEYGVTTEGLRKIITSQEYNQHPIITKHVMLDMVGEKEGMVTYTLIITSRAHEDLVEILNADIVPMMKRYMGNDSIRKIEENPIRAVNRTGHNNFMIRKFNGESIDIKDSDIFVWD